MNENAADSSLSKQFESVRRFTDRITASLSPEDCMVQSMEDASPVRWHLAHGTWFFETFVLKQEADYTVFDKHFSYLFNSYYNAIGEQFPRPNRGTISRPGLDCIREYRRYVDRELLSRLQSPDFVARHAETITVGLNHEQQHQELILTDIKNALASNPMLPVYEDREFAPSNGTTDSWAEITDGKYDVGHDGDGFCFDNELPRHTVFLPAFRISLNLTTCGQFIEFINDEGYERPELWLSLGWNAVKERSWNAPLYWMRRDGRWMQFTLAGLTPVDPDWPICHVSYFEADAFARWAGKRLPTEFEWEVACRSLTETRAEANTGQFADKLFAGGYAIHPTLSSGGFFGSVWQWTANSYQAYPGYRPPPGAIGEYNGKFMCNQYVLRGGSVATSQSHIRDTYRNFFPADARWQFSGFRLAE
ncbi:ergothioneine biosynthesis protein EgtB [Allorhodopirellula heiligendammensis]|uniref:Iron(II)-dependent oxidoreductase EgtB n=1 Tax=Allorhodopirellula heiligendammensis TaxID=2714739 RepID=A0A5C6C520_9BACT|nr:ergothioneine biosynthesis protein EgtB [Allorhodopirellula heiligendammensis]TWU17899.1 Iron(II)-dependent oxidoreductase EgtB [Allorhodopirellula heiligendammensis]